MTADDSLIINHDPKYNDLPIETTRFADLRAFPLANGEKLPTLRNYLQRQTYTLREAPAEAGERTRGDHGVASVELVRKAQRQPMALARRCTAIATPGDDPGPDT